MILMYCVLFAARSVAHYFATGDGRAAALEEPSPASEKKKERLSRQERTALVESFVIKCVNITLLLADQRFNSFACILSSPELVFIQ